ncbi:2-dehydropantoate 2-reductase [Alkalicoccobacillus porphyridii]|nr:2-dehydropantoate 2-reductase [Alkalicoccobacillus porphyridii]
MKMMIIGGGAMGLFLAAKLSQSDFDVTLCVRTKEQALALSREGLTLKDGSSSYQLPVKAKMTQEAPIEEADIIIVTVKSYSLTTLFAHLEPRLTKHQTILFMQNGMSHIELAENLAVETIGLGIMSHGAMRESETMVHHTGTGTFRWAQFKGAPDILDEVMNKIDRPGFEVYKEDDWYILLWSKLLANVCINPITALTGVRNGELLNSEELLHILREVFEEAMKLHPLPDHKEEYWKQVLQICEQTKNNQSSMLVDIRHHRQTEIESILGYVCNMAKAKHITLPMITFLYKAITEREQSFRSC